VRAPLRLHGLPTFGFALGGLLVGHAASYALAVPDPLHRDLVLQRAGHGYLSAAAEAGLILTLAAVAAIVVRAWSGRGATAGDSFGSIAWLLGGVQVGGFIGQELLERVVAGAPLADRSSEHVLAVGVAVQIVVALVGATALTWLARASVRVVRSVQTSRRDAPRPAPVLAIAPPPDDRPRVAAVRWTPGVRAPPSL
jgi:hypothetical protein